MVRVKICGITNSDDAHMCAHEGADALGFIFWKKSARSISVSSAKKIIACLDPYVMRIGVFVDECKDTVFEVAESLGLDGIQFHGKESPSYCNTFRSRYRVIKAFFPKRPGFSVPQAYKADAYLVDIRIEEKDRALKTIETGVLSRIAKGTRGRFILSGGLSPENVCPLIRKVRPFGVDVARGVESLPGKKDPRLVRRFIRNVKKLH